MSELSGIYEKDHIVQFYATKTSLLNNLKSFIGGGLLSGDPCVVIATAEHRADLEKQLTAHDINVSAYKATGQLVCLDAVTTLSKIVSDGKLSEQALLNMVGKIFNQLALSGKTIRAFGEMVALLASEGNYKTALEVEKFWNSIAKQYSITLFCAYPANQFSAARNQSVQNKLGEISAQHVRVIRGQLYGKVPAAG